jgi:aspartyl aminopeptidase
MIYESNTTENGVLMNKKLFNYIANSPTAYQACAHTADILKQSGFNEIRENEKWVLEENKGYFVKRNGSSLIAFKVPAGGFKGFMIAAAHSDSPCLKIKENAEMTDKYYVRLSTETYGGMIYSSWLDLPLAVAGRVCVKGEKGIEIRLVDTKEPVALIPNVAIHMNRSVNSGMNYNASVDLIPLFGGESEKDSFKGMIAELAGVKAEDVVTTDLFLYNPQSGYEWASFVSAPRLDDLQCAFSALEAFLGAERSAGLPVYALFDNEEVGSQTKQGAASTFLYDVLKRVIKAFGGDEDTYLETVANSFMVSCDNAHSIHPNHPEFSDKNHTVHMNGGVVIKYNANQKYTSDAVSVALFKTICDEAGVPTQYYANRADMPGGSTLGNIANTQVSLNTVDIGLAQLAMHSSFETAGKDDTEYMVRALTAFYSSGIRSTAEGYEF